MVGSFFCPGDFLLNAYRISPNTLTVPLHTFSPGSCRVQQQSDKQFHWSSWWWMALTVLLFFFPRPRFILQCWGTNWHPSSHKAHLYAFLKFEITWQQKTREIHEKRRLNPVINFSFFLVNVLEKFFLLLLYHVLQLDIHTVPTCMHV